MVVIFMTNPVRNSVNRGIFLLIHIGSTVTTNRGRIITNGTDLLQIGAAISNLGNYYK